MKKKKKKGESLLAFKDWCFYLYDRKKVQGLDWGDRRVASIKRLLWENRKVLKHKSSHHTAYFAFYFYSNRWTNQIVAKGDDCFVQPSWEYIGDQPVRLPAQSHLTAAEENGTGVRRQLWARPNKVVTCSVFLLPTDAMPQQSNHPIKSHALPFGI